MHDTRRKPSPLIAAALAACLLLLSRCGGSPAGENGAALPVAGRVDLSRWSSEAGELRTLSLKGQWLFKRGDDPGYSAPDLDDSGWEIHSVPVNWMQLESGCYSGKGWYRLHMKFPETPVDTALGVQLGWIDDADEAWFNGRPIGRTGRFPSPGVGVGHAYDRTRIYPVPGHLVRWGSDNVLAVRISSMDFDTAGIYRGEQLIGPLGALKDRFFLVECMLLVLAGIYFLIASYHVLLFFKERKTYSNLFFGTFTLLMSIIMVLRGEMKYFVTDNFSFLKYIEYSIELALLALFIHFLVHYFDKKLVTRATAVFDTLIAAELLFLAAAYSNLTLYFYLTTYVSYPLFIAVIGYCLVFLVRRAARNTDARFMLAGAALMSATIMADLVTGWYDFSIPWIAHYGVSAFIIAIALAMGNRFVNLYREVRAARRQRDGFIAMQQEIAIARRIQQSILPKRPPALPGLRVAAHYLPTGAVGGDYYDFLVSEDGGAGFIIADVTGHGVPASLISSMMKTAFHFSGRLAHEPGRMLSEINMTLSKLIAGNLVTAAYLFIDPPRRRLSFANAGHLPPIIARRDGGVMEPDRKGLILGWKPDAAYGTTELELLPGDRIILCTDGITEARDGAGRLFGAERLIEAVRLGREAGAEEFIKGMMDRVSAHAGASGSLADDVTIVVIDVE